MVALPLALAAGLGQGKASLQDDRFGNRGRHHNGPLTLTVAWLFLLQLPQPAGSSK